MGAGFWVPRGVKRVSKLGFELGNSERTCGIIFVDCDSLEPHTHCGAFGMLFFTLNRETHVRVTWLAQATAKEAPLGLVFE